MIDKKPGGRKPHPPETYEKIRQMASPNVSLAEIANELGLPYSTVQQYVYRMGLPYRSVRIREAQKDEIMRLAAAGMTATDISSRTQKSVDTVCRAVFERSGIKFSDYHRQVLEGIAPEPKQELTPCRVRRRDWPVCRYYRCYLRHKCESFRQAVTQGKTEDKVPPDTHASSGLTRFLS